MILRARVIHHRSGPTVTIVGDNTNDGIKLKVPEARIQSYDF
jgi:hypothetical protein